MLLVSASVNSDTVRMNIPRILSITLAGLLAIAVAGEIWLRLEPRVMTGSSSYIERQLRLQSEAWHARYEPEPDLGAVLAPGRGERVQTPDYSYTLQTDHAGFTNRDPWPGRIEVAVLGNSLIMGAGVGYEGQFTTLLQRDLGNPVLNLGVHGGGTGHQLRLYLKFARPLRPRVVIAALWPTWEIENSLKFERWLEQDPRPDFTAFRYSYRAGLPESAAAAPEEPSAWRRTLGWLSSRSALLRWLRRSDNGPRLPADPVERARTERGEIVYLSVRDQARLLAGWNRAEMPELRERFFAPLAMLRDEVEADGGRFLVVLFPSKEELYAAAAIPGLLQPVQIAREELTQRKLPFLDLYPQFQQTARSRAAFFPRDMHLNAEGHQLVARILADEIRRPSDPDCSGPDRGPCR